MSKAASCQYGERGEREEREEEREGEGGGRGDPDPKKKSVVILPPLASATYKEAILFPWGGGGGERGKTILCGASFLAG